MVVNFLSKKNVYVNRGTLVENVLNPAKIYIKILNFAESETKFKHPHARKLKNQKERLYSSLILLLCPGFKFSYLNPALVLNFHTSALS